MVALSECRDHPHDSDATEHRGPLSLRLESQGVEEDSSPSQPGWFALLSAQPARECLFVPRSAEAATAQVSLPSLS
jgi:hypothetical protein